MIPAPISIAPMMDKTHRHFRWFLRQLTRQALLYTEMITPAAIIHGDRERLLSFDPIERPLVLQLGGSDPAEVAEAVKIAEDWDYDEYNLNVGCPSDRVQHRNFGACLMADPDLVARLLEAMHRAGTRPVSVKHRIGITNRIRGEPLPRHGHSAHAFHDFYEQLSAFVGTLQLGPAQRYIVHARVAVLEGLSPKENRRIPPLRYDNVYRLKEEYPRLRIEINGGIRSHDEITAHLRHSDGVMLGRLAYERPWRLAELDRRYYAAHAADNLCNPTRREVIEAWFRYVLQRSDEGANFRGLMWPVLELFAGERGSRKWKQTLSRHIPAGMGAREFLAEGLHSAPAELLDQRAVNAVAQSAPQKFPAVNGYNKTSAEGKQPDLQ